MTTLIVNIKDSADAKKIADALRLMDSVTDIRIDEKKQTFEEVCAECNAVSAEVFIDGLKERVTKLYRNAKS